MLRLCLLFILLHSALSLDCTQIPDSQIFAGNTVHLPANYSTPQTAPANFNCLYRIRVPGNSSYGLLARVTLYNGIRGVNDRIEVVDQTGYKVIMNNRTGLGGTPYRYLVIPGAQMRIQVITKSVYMESKFLITVSYGNANIGKTSPLKTGGDMNYFDMDTTRDGVNLFSSVTFTSDQQIFMTLATKSSQVLDDCYDCVVVDGTFENQTQVYRIGDVFFKKEGRLVTRSNAITVVSFYDGFLGFVLNPVSESEQFTDVDCMATNPMFSEGRTMKTFFPGFTEAVEVVNFDSTGIILTDLQIVSGTCEAYIVSGPPNNASQVLLDFSTKPKLPYTFDLKYFTVINVDCYFSFGVMSEH